MGEFEILDTDEPLPKRLERHAFDRLIMLSDGVFAIAITLLALEIRPPQAWSGDLADLVRQTWRSLFGFTLGFVLVGFYWMAHRRIFARLRRVDGVCTVLTLMLLGLVSLAPAVAELMAVQGPAKSLKVYFISQAGTSVALALLWGYAAFPGKLVDASIGPKTRAFSFVGMLVLPLVFCAAGLATTGSHPSPVALLVLVLFAGVLGIGRRLLARAGGPT